ncbi:MULTISPECIES: hypothetical protein [unclassified Pseudomonas]|uniref:hypothetical protein n=1 Tax=unclassified Pseudomonas TaxID=196821 RepID=UPI0039B726CB
MATYVFHPQIKLFYRPIEAALRWRNLIHHEPEILKAAWSRPDNFTDLFSQWPGLQETVEKIDDAIRHGDLRYGCLGISVPMGTYVEPYQLTIRHSDLLNWMRLFYPDQRPAFLFGPSKEPLETISLGTFLALQADRDVLLRELKALQRQHHEILVDLQTIGVERDDLRAMIKTHGHLSERSELTYNNIIGALLNLFLEHSPAGNPLSVFRNQSAIVDAIVARYSEIPGLSKRTLDEKFAAANRSFKKNK